MVDIIHRVGIKGTKKEIYHALTTDEGLSKWWTSNTSGAGDVGSVITFKFDDTEVLFQVKSLQSAKSVKWQHTGIMPDAWIGTEVVFELEEGNNQTYVNFSHQKWKNSSNFMGHCSMKWATFLLSLKELIETGRGKAFPHDIHIDHDE
jgi:uncharacterized protein YndB with AHSA1/START domain